MPHKHGRDSLPLCQTGNGQQHMQHGTQSQMVLHPGSRSTIRTHPELLDRYRLWDEGCCLLDPQTSSWFHRPVKHVLLPLENELHRIISDLNYFVINRAAPAPSWIVWLSVVSVGVCAASLTLIKRPDALCLTLLSKHQRRLERHRSAPATMLWLTVRLSICGRLSTVSCVLRSHMTVVEWWRGNLPGRVCTEPHLGFWRDLHAECFHGWSLCLFAVTRLLRCWNKRRCSVCLTELVMITQ